MVWRKDDQGTHRIWDSIALEFAQAVNKPNKNAQQNGAGQPAPRPGVEAGEPRQTLT
jgi:hypothetical protein